MTAEIWKPIPGYEGRYEVSDFGRVRSLDRISSYQRIDQYSGRLIVVDRHHKGQLLRPGRQSSGHLSVALGKGNSKLVHVLVLLAFVGPCPDGHEGLHGDDVPGNNHLPNLRWGTRSENLHDAVRNGGKGVGEKAYNAKLTQADVDEIKATQSWPFGSIAETARKLGVKETTVRSVINGKTWRASPPEVRP